MNTRDRIPLNKRSENANVIQHFTPGEAKILPRLGYNSLNLVGSFLQGDSRKNFQT